jgi:hypothetical protein
MSLSGVIGRYRVVAGVIGLIAGCSSQPAIQTVEVKVPVPVACVESMPDRPTIQTQAEIVKLPDFDAVFQLNRAVLQWEGYGATLEAVLQGCVSK